ncbi:DUF882 domain-containing protein [Aeromonas dhakensis]|uniref:DUF882 domain-containing protein n=1 Tax=Aeromonas dhakensis TaxID=196024 RepID=UPI003985B4E9
MLLTRRQFITKVAASSAAISALACPSIAMAGKLILPTQYASDAESRNFWDKPRVLQLKRLMPNGKWKEAEACYWNDGALDAEGYSSICEILGDVTYGKYINIDIRLLNLLRGGLGWLSSNVTKDPVFIVNSGFRTKEHNNKLEGAAKNSKHLLGQAVDGRVEGMDIRDLGRLFATFQAGGVGFYVKQRFVHVDVADIRYWVK